MDKPDEERMNTGEVARAETHRSLDMLDREVGLAGPYPELGADQPTTRKARIEGEGAINERQHRIDVLTEIRERIGRINQVSGSSPALSRARSARSIAAERFCARFSAQPLISINKRQNAAFASAGP